MLGPYSLGKLMKWKPFNQYSNIYALLRSLLVRETNEMET